MCAHVSCCLGSDLELLLLLHIGLMPLLTLCFEFVVTEMIWWMVLMWFLVMKLQWRVGWVFLGIFRWNRVSQAKAGASGVVEKSQCTCVKPSSKSWAVCQVETWKQVTNPLVTHISLVLANKNYIVIVQLGKLRQGVTETTCEVIERLRVSSKDSGCDFLFEMMILGVSVWDL